MIMLRNVINKLFNCQLNTIFMATYLIIMANLWMAGLKILFHILFKFIAILFYIFATRMESSLFAPTVNERNEKKNLFLS